MIDILKIADKHMSGEIVWGQRDCCTGACDVFMELYGFDPMLPLRGTYSTKFEARREILRRGDWINMTIELANLCGLSDGTGGFGEIGLTKAGRANMAGGRALAISGGDMGWIVRCDTGYAVTKMDIIDRSWAWQP